MSFNFNGVKANLEGINQYLEANGIKLSDTEKQKLGSIFLEADRPNSTNDKNTLGNGELDIIEQNKFKNAIENEKEGTLAKIKSFIKDFFNGVNDKQYNKDITHEPVSTRVNKQTINTFNTHSSVKTKYEWSEAKFAKVLDIMLNNKRYNGKFKNSVLQGKAKAFLNSAQKFGIDPRVLVAIAMHESGRGMSLAAKDKSRNNVGGLKGLKFKSVEESIDSIARTINTKYNAGYTTINKIGINGVYCDKKVGAKWANEVNSYLNFFNKYY